jgi:gamma-glutamyltranspeptidase/glutathione hydrolase
MLLQSLNILENFDLKSMGFNSAKYIHTLYQTMNMVFADRDFYYGDPAFPPAEPMQGLLSKEYAKQRAKQIMWERNNANVGPGDPYPFQNATNPYLDVLKKRGFSFDTTNTNRNNFVPSHDVRNNGFAVNEPEYMERLWMGTTSVEAADEEGWVVSITPSGGWIPACIAGNTGIGMSQRGQSFVLDPSLNPFNVIEPGKRPRVTLTPTLALKDGKPFLSFAVQGGDTQDQNLLQFFINMVDFGMNVQEACEAPNINTNQLWLSLGGEKVADRRPRAGQLLLHDNTPEWVRKELRQMGYTLTFDDRTSGPINAIWFDWKHNTFWGGSSNHGDDYGISW